MVSKLPVTEKLKPTDIIAITAILVLGYLLATGHNGYISGLMAVVLTYYFVRRKESAK